MSSSLRMMPDCESVIFTGWLVPRKSIAWIRVSRACLYFSSIGIVSWATIEFSRVLSSIRLRSLSCSYATSG
jgi:hypothetical protein